MDYVSQFHREVLAFEAAARSTIGPSPAPLIPSCPGWSMADLVLHLGGVHRYLSHVIEGRLQKPPDPSDLSLLSLPADVRGWPRPERAPHHGPVPEGLIDWFAEGAAVLESLLATSDPDTAVWTWSTEQTVGFWQRMQSIEAAVHRWDAENAIGTAQPIDAAPAADAVRQTFEVMAPARRAWTQAPPGSGESYRFRQTDGPTDLRVRFEAANIHIDQDTGPCDVELTGTASDLMLFLWQRLPADQLEVDGDPQLPDRYFTLVPPV
ncbi:maleylpyruvate isomerase family mycothiol-dependent enzyme [Spirillospora sp. NPDC048911]|uniref:maleylpyruvate isomerase family mycothiol-dependent enzyme n=1 Tax=Spirillospora sp. NPDC048911 TaxID=3364527 RepID=UPI00371CAE72